MLQKLLEIRPGITAVIGAGGKTTLLQRLSQSLPGRVILCTTTRIFPPDMPVLDPTPEALSSLPRVCCAARSAPEGKLMAPSLSLSQLKEYADFVLVEADGAKRLPLKAHLPHEPVLPPDCGNVICVVGASGFGQPVAAAVHRPQRFCALSGLSMDSPVTPEAVARVLEAEALHHRVFLNQMDISSPPAEEFASFLTCPAAAGSLWEERYLCLR